MRCHYLPRCTNRRQAQLCARPALIKGVFPTCISASTLPWGGVLLAISPSFLPASLPLPSYPPTVSRNGPFSISRHLSNPSKALPQVVDCRSFRLAWAKGFAARRSIHLPSYIPHCSLSVGVVGVCWMSKTVRLTYRKGNPSHHRPWPQRTPDSYQGYRSLR